MIQRRNFLERASLGLIALVAAPASAKARIVAVNCAQEAGLTYVYIG
jgi:hypothetical protein